MSMSCEYCGASTADSFLCRNHQNRLRNVLTDLAEAWTDSEITLARLNKHAPQAGGGRSGHGQLAFNVNCSDVRHETNDVVLMWAKEVGEGLMPGWLQSVPQQCRWLAQQATLISGRDYAGQMLTELEGELDELNRAVDRPNPKTYLGAHECGADILAYRTDVFVKCRGCGETVDVERHIDQVMTECEGRIGSAAEISALCHTVFGGLVTASMIRGYAFRGRITQRSDGIDERGRTVPYYRVGDVLDAAGKASESTRSRRQAERDARAARETTGVSA